MPSMNIREVDVTSLGAFKRKAAAEGLTLRAWVLAVLKVALMDDDGEVSLPEVEREPAPAALVPNATCRRCDRPIAPDPKAVKMWYCHGCRRQLDASEVRQ
jgi:hypothetical protein